MLKTSKLRECEQIHWLKMAHYYTYLASTGWWIWIGLNGGCEYALLMLIYQAKENQSSSPCAMPWWVWWGHLKKSWTLFGESNPQQSLPMSIECPSLILSM